jgi:hypothetical protein
MIVTVNPVSPIIPWTGQPGYLCLPLTKNIETPGNINWRKMNCPECSQECWMTPAAKVAIKRSQRNGNDGALKSVCMECALRKGVE